MPHHTTYSFCFDNLNNTTLLRDCLKSLYPQLNSIFLTHSNKYSCLTISGSATNILNARADVLKLQPIEVSIINTHLNVYVLINFFILFVFRLLYRFIHFILV